MLHCRVFLHGKDRNIEVRDVIFSKGLAFLFWLEYNWEDGNHYIHAYKEYEKLELKGKDMKEQYIHRYSVPKTLRFRLIPQGNTQKNVERMGLLAGDEALARNYPIAKDVCDRYHKKFIDDCLSNFALQNVAEYAELYFRSNRTSEENQKMDDIAKAMRKEISELFTKENKETYDQLQKKDLIENKKLAGSVAGDDEKEIIESFRGRTVYFTGYNQSRANMYTGEGKASEIAFRLIDQNLPRFLDNVRIAETILENLSQSDIEQIDTDFHNTHSIFAVPYFNKTLTQHGIDQYNQIIGGYSRQDGTKIKGYNEYINLYNQKTKRKLPRFKPLYKQILSDKETVSFIPRAFASDDELLSTLNAFYVNKDTDTGRSIQEVICELDKLFNDIQTYDAGGIYITNGPAITFLSNAVCNDWSRIQNAIVYAYDKAHSGGKKEITPEKRAEVLKKIKSYTLLELQRYVEQAAEKEESISAYIKEHFSELCAVVSQKYGAVAPLLTTEYICSTRLLANDEAIEKIKDFMDAIMEIYHFAKIFLGSGNESSKDDVFYGIFTPLYDQLSEVVELYNKVRNYVTQKPYTNEKFMLIFNRSDFLNTWAQPLALNAKEAHLFEKNGLYYVFITASAMKTTDWEGALYSKDHFEQAYHIEYYKQKPDNKNVPRLFIRSKGDRFAPAVEKYNLPIADIIDLYDNGYFKAEYKKKNPALYYKSLEKLIDYFKLGFSRHEDYKDFAFHWKNSADYESITDFYNDTKNSCYELKRVEINWNGLMELVDSGRGYLYHIYSKDFSEHTKGMPNLHTLYFKMLFDERNLKNGCYQLLGGAEMFCRKGSIKPQEATVHPKGVPLKSKNPRNKNPENTFAYDLIKDKRYTETQYFLHLPIMMNYTADDTCLIKDFNLGIRKALQKADSQYIIGIDRGERNLIYICVINEKGEIVEQMSLNEIVSDNGYTVDYHDLLDRRENERGDARKNWRTIENIKELKEGYMSQVIHKICELVLKYDAVIAMEDLNGGFMNSRIKIEKQVYRKFEKMLTDKLNYLVDKKADPMSDGGLLRAYQLTNKPDLNKSVQHGMQDGIVFYIPAWCTSKIDPTTGFVDLLKPKYTNKEEAKDFFKRFQKICFNEAENMFEFHFHYPDFQRGITAGNTDWTVYTNGSRIRTFRNPEKNNQWDNTDIVLTDAFKALFAEYAISCNADMKEAILAQDSPKFFKELCGLLSLTLQMRNSITGRTDVDYIISPVKNAAGRFYDSRKAASDLPCDADANGAYNIARKVLLFIRRLQAQEESNLMNKDLEKITNAQWLSFVQNGHE